MILWENVAYLAPPGPRREAFEQLRNTVGTSPTVILTAKQQTLESVTANAPFRAARRARWRADAPMRVVSHSAPDKTELTRPGLAWSLAAWRCIMRAARRRPRQIIAVAEGENGRGGIPAGYLRWSEALVTDEEALAFVKDHGVVLQAARGAVPSLAEAIVGGPIRGSWWGHPKGHDIFRAAEAVSDSGEVLVCKLVDGKITYVHRRLWPALVKLAARFRKGQLARVWNEHTPSGAHRLRSEAFPTWVPGEVMREAEELAVSDAETMLRPVLALARKQGRPPSRARRSPAPRSGRPRMR